jgi:pimeloyl-ACP methyl ester carboxylesterase
MLQINGLSLYVEDHGSGRPVLLLHGWPDSAYLWRNQIPFPLDASDRLRLRSHGPGCAFNRSSRPIPPWIVTTASARPSQVVTFLSR